MEDEELSYSGYAEETERGLVRAAAAGDAEEFSYSGYAEGGARVEESEERPAYGDFIIEEFSSEVNVPRIAKKTGVSQKLISYIFAVLYIAIGVLCVAITEQVQSVIPYIVGASMIAFGAVRFITALAQREYRTVKTNRTASSLIFVALGIMIIVEYDWAITFISIVWGILGLMEAARAFNHAFSKMAAGKVWLHHVVKGVVECVFAFMLLYRPDHHITLHIIVFGVQLIVGAVFMLPCVKRHFATE